MKTIITIASIFLVGCVAYSPSVPKAAMKKADANVQVKIASKKAALAEQAKAVSAREFLEHKYQVALKVRMNALVECEAGDARSCAMGDANLKALNVAEQALADEIEHPSVTAPNIELDAKDLI